MSDDLNPKDAPEQLPALTPVAQPLVAYQAHAFSSFTHITERPEGQTVASMVASLNFPADYDGFVHVWINDLPLDRADWDSVVPSAGQMVYVRVMPQGRGGGGGKDILRTIASIAIAVVAFYYAPVLMGFQAGTAGWAAASAAGFSSYLAVAGISAGVAILGNMALNALIPPPKLELDFGNGLGSQKNQLTGSSNRYAPYAPIPRIFGKRRVYPLLAGRPYSETQGDDEYLRMALLVGWGPLKITDIRIGETPITSFADVQYEVREGWSNDSALTLYTNTITEAAYSITLAPPVSGVNSYTQRTTESGVSEITVDVTAPAGLAKFENDGKRSSIDVDVTVQYRAVGSGTWLTPSWSNASDTGLDVNGRIRLSGADTSAIRRTGRFAVAVGQYEVSLTRATTEYDTTQHVQEVRWTTMRSIKPSYPVQQANVALIALRMKATGQLNGIPQQINCVVESYLPVYSGGSWSYQITRNPAWAFADVLRRRGGETYLADDRIDLTTISAWAAACDTTAPNASEPYWTFDGVIEGGTVFQVLRQIASSARANYTVRDGKHSVVRDIQQTVPIQHITPRNSFGYSGSKVFLDYPHALRVVFVNAAKNFEEDERIVYDDGYNAGNATKFETLELFGCTSATQAYREGRYFIAAARLRPETHVVSMDIENLRCTIGDLVQFQHDVVSIGIAAARVLSVNGSVIVLDQQFETAAGTSYALRVRRSNGDTTVVSLQSPGTAVTDAFVALSGATGVAAGDLAMFGVSTSVTAPMIVKKIEPGPDFTAKLHLVDAQSGVYTADTGAIPPFNSNITTTQPVENQRPTAPTILDVRSDDAVALLLPDGTLQVRMSVVVNPPVSSLVRAEYYDVQWRALAADNWIEERFARGSPIFLFPVQDGVSYQIRVRAVSEYGVAGDWSGITTHTVSGKNNPPGNVANLVAVLKTGAVQITWTAATDADYDSTELRYGTTWAAGTFLWRGASSTYAWPRPANATYKVWAAHRDTSGNYSAVPTSVDVTVTNAVDPQRTILLTIYRRSPAASTPALPSADATYDFSTNTLSGLTNSWQITAPAGTDPLWVSTATASGNITDTITPAEWSAATLLLQDGASAVSVQITRAAAQLFAYADGSVPDFSAASGFLTVRQGATDVTDLATLSASAGSGVTGTINTSNNSPVNGQIKGFYRVTALSGDTGTLTLSATYNGETYSATFAVSKNKTGYEIVSSLPTTNLFVGRMVFLTTDNKLYRYTGSAWTTAVPTTDLTGTISDAQIAGLAASKVTGQLNDSQIEAVAAAKLTGQLVASQIADASISTAKFASGIEPITVVASVPGTKSTNSIFNTTDGKLYRWNGSAYVATVPAGDISGTLAAAQIASVAASQITGQLSDTQLAAIGAAKVTGQITGTQITDGAISTAKLAAGSVTAATIAADTITAAQIAANAITSSELAAGAVVAGKIAAGSIQAGDIAAGTITGDRLAANTITASQIASNTITAGQIAAGAIGASQIAAGAITTDKLLVTGGGAALNDDPGFTDASAWSLYSGVLPVFGTVTDGAVGSRVARSSGAGVQAWINVATARRVPVDPNKAYRLRGWARTVSGSGSTLYIGLALFDAAGANITGDGSQWSYAAAGGVTVPATWTKYQAAYGTGTGIAFPANARTMSPLAILSYGGGTAIHEVQDLRIEEMASADLIVDGAVSAAKIAAGAVTTAKLDAGAVTADTIAANAITSAKIEAGAITTAKIAAGAVDATQIAAGAVTAGKIAALAITSSNIASGAITTDKLDVGAVTAANINVTSLSSMSANIGTLTAGVVRNTADTFRVDVDNGRTIARTGTYMKVTGIPFGSASQFIEWFGPYFANLSSCTEANAVYYLKTNGSAYFGGTLSAGILTNRGATSDLGDGAEIIVGPFGTNGNTKTVTLSYSFGQQYTEYQGSSTGTGGGSISATVKLYRKIGSGSETEVATLSVSGTWSYTTDPEPQPGPTYMRFWTQDMSGALTYTDSVSGTDNRTYRAKITARSLGFATSNGGAAQRVEVISVEQ